MHGDPMQERFLIFYFSFFLFFFPLHLSVHGIQFTDADADGG